MKMLRILIADDNRDAANGLARLLAIIGHNTQVAFDGATAIRMAEVFRPEVVLLDLGLPDMSGYVVCQRIRAHLGSELLAAIAITGWSSEPARIQSFQSGFDQHIVKPARIDLLEQTLSVLTTEAE